MGHHRVLTILQWILGLYFIYVGVMHFIVPDGLPEMMGWMYELSDTLHWVSGAAEILGGLGLILPGLTKIQPQLTAWAAGGLMVVMAGALIWHANRGETQSIAFNVVLFVILGYIAYGRAKLAPYETVAA